MTDKPTAAPAEPVRIELGCAGHLIVAAQCQWRRHTQIGKYRVSSIGNYYPNGGTERGTIGAGDESLFETLVFETTGEQDAENEGCGCRTIKSWSAIDGERYATAGAAQEGHERYVSKYAAVNESGEASLPMADTSSQPTQGEASLGNNATAGASPDPRAGMVNVAITAACSEPCECLCDKVMAMTNEQVAALIAREPEMVCRLDEGRPWGAEKGIIVGAIELMALRAAIAAQQERIAKLERERDEARAERDAVLTQMKTFNAVVAERDAKIVSLSSERDALLDLLSEAGFELTRSVVFRRKQGKDAP